MDLKQTLEQARAAAREGRAADAIAGFHRLCEAEPGDWRHWFSLGKNLIAAGRPADAIGPLQQAVRIDPSRPVSHRLLVETAMGEYTGNPAAQAIIDQTLAQQTDHSGNAALLVVLRARSGRLDEALRLAEAAVQRFPEEEAAWKNYVVALLWANRIAECLEACDRALARHPQSRALHLSRGFALLISGQFRAGWVEYEWRLGLATASGGPAVSPPDPSLPRWDGAPLAGRHILLLSEQGYGDAIQFARLAPLLAGQGARVTLAVADPLLPLLRRLDKVEVTGAHYRVSADCYAPLLSLPGILGIDGIDDIPGSVPYLGQDPERCASWRDRLAGATAGRKVIGLAWTGNPGHEGDWLRSMKLEQLAAWGRLPGLCFLTLSPDSRGRDPLPAGFPLVDVAGQIQDFADTAALIALCDLVISVDSAPGHLAGALGKPVWLLLPYAPDWRWLLDRADSPWYPTMRLFRQPTLGDWSTVIDEVARALPDHFAAAPATAADAGSLIDAANRLNVAGRYEEVLALSATVDAGDPQAWVLGALHGHALYRLGRYAEAAASLEQATAAGERLLTRSAADAPALATAWLWRGGNLGEQARTTEAVAAYRRALALNPECRDARFSLASALLLDGQFADGWKEFESRIVPATSDAGPWLKAPAIAAKPWRGEFLRGKTIVVAEEQGAGDMIQFLRYAALLAERRAEVVVVARPALRRLLASARGVSRVVDSEQLPTLACDYWVFPLSLPGLFGTRAATIPNRVPYLAAGAAAIGRWRARLDTFAAARLKVGLVWAGNPAHWRNARRSLGSVADFGPVLKVPGVAFVSLQLSPSANDALADRGIFDAAADLGDFADTAAAIAACDLVIGVDTSVVHLAGALAKPVWTLLPFAPDWRWQLARDDSPWYPTMRLFRQPRPGDWPAVMDRLAAALAEQASR